MCAYNALKKDERWHPACVLSMEIKPIEIHDKEYIAQTMIQKSKKTREGSMGKVFKGSLSQQIIWNEKM